MLPLRDTHFVTRILLCHPNPLWWCSVMLWSIRAIPAWDIYGPASPGARLMTPTPFNLTTVIPCHCLMAVALAHCQSTQRHWVFVCVPHSVNVQTDIQHHGMAGQSAVCHSNVGQSNMHMRAALVKGKKEKLSKRQNTKKITFRQIKKKKPNESLCSWSNPCMLSTTH